MVPIFGHAFRADGRPRGQMVGFMQTLFPGQILNSRMVKSTAISDAGITNQTLYEVDGAHFTHLTYDRAMEALIEVNEEIVALIRGAWGRESARLTAVQTGNSCVSTSLVGRGRAELALRISSRV